MEIESLRLWWCDREGFCAYDVDLRDGGVLTLATVVLLLLRLKGKRSRIDRNAEEASPEAESGNIDRLNGSLI